VIGFTLQDADHSRSDRPIYAVTRMGALLSVVVDHREALVEQRIAKRPFAGATPQRPVAPAY
jgi:hypothetical protein